MEIKINGYQYSSPVQHRLSTIISCVRVNRDVPFCQSLVLLKNKYNNSEDMRSTPSMHSIICMICMQNNVLCYRDRDHGVECGSHEARLKYFPSNRGVLGSTFINHPLKNCWRLSTKTDKQSRSTVMRNDTHKSRLISDSQVAAPWLHFVSCWV